LFGIRFWALEAEATAELVYDTTLKAGLAHPPSSLALRWQSLCCSSNASELLEVVAVDDCQ
jgi:hypothetical protein